MFNIHQQRVCCDETFKPNAMVLHIKSLNILICEYLFVASNLTTTEISFKHEEQYYYRILLQVVDLLSSMRSTMFSSTHKWPFTNVMLVSATKLILRMAFGYIFDRLNLRLIFSNTTLWNGIPF